MFFAPSIGYYVVTRYEDVESVFLDHETFSAATAQLPLVALVPEALRILAEGGHRPQPSMVSLDPPEHTPAAAAGVARVHAAPRGGDGAAHPRNARRAARRGRRERAVRPRAGADLPAAGDDHLLVHGRARARLGHAEGLVRQPRGAGLGPARRGRADRARAQHGRLPRLPARARGRQGRRARRRLLQRPAGDPRRGPRRAHPRGGRLDPVLALVRRPRDDQLPDRQSRPPAAGGPLALGGGRGGSRAHPRRRRRDAALRHLRAGLAPRHAAPGDAGRRRAARGRQAVPLARRHGARSRRVPRARAVRSGAGERPPPPRVRQGHPLLRRREPGQARGAARRRGPGDALPRPAARRRAADPVPPEHLLPRAAGALGRPGQ